MLIQTADKFKCEECKYEGPVNCYEVVDMVPYGNTNVPMYTYTDHHCPECGSFDVEEK